MVSLRGEPLRHPAALTAMAESLHHRGPDSQGVHRGRHVGIGCDRLRIMDLRQRADQPFCDPRERCWLVCNGEIYNSPELRRRYRDYPFRSRSDVEVILPLFLDRGAAGLGDLEGMFALAIWDEPSQTLVLARDRAGERSLFYSSIDGELWFASEVQALLSSPKICRDLDETAISQYLALGYVPEPRTAFRAIRKLEAGTLACFTAEGTRSHRYWDPGAVETRELRRGPALSQLRSLLTSAIRKQMTADVPVGVFVSGGLDSALLASIAARQASGGRLKTFTAKFSEGSYDESSWAASCARRLGTEHHEVLVDERSLTEALGAVTETLAEPLADPAILPTYLVARKAREHVKVALSGEGADELFGGYPTYIGHQLVPYLLALPRPARRLMCSAAELLPASRKKVTLEFLLKRFLADAEKPWLERHLGWFGIGAGALAAAGERPELPEAFAAGDSPASVASRAMLLDYRTYLPDNLLVKIDRATMLSSLEARAPFLDRELSAFALALPERFKLRRLTTKWLLKEAAREWLPRRTIYRKKRGLSVPVASWLDRGLRPEVDRLLAPERLERQDLLDPLRVQRLLAEHRAGVANHARPLWTVVVLQYWLERWLPERAGRESRR